MTTPKGSRWWHGLPAHAVPSAVYRAESARLRAAIDLQREAVNAAKYSAPPAEPVTPPAEPLEGEDAKEAEEATPERGVYDRGTDWRYFIPCAVCGRMGPCPHDDSVQLIG